MGTFFFFFAAQFGHCLLELVASMPEIGVAKKTKRHGDEMEGLELVVVNIEFEEFQWKAWNASGGEESSGE